MIKHLLSNSIASVKASLENGRRYFSSYLYRLEGRKLRCLLGLRPFSTSLAISHLLCLIAISRKDTIELYGAPYCTRLILLAGKRSAKRCGGCFNSLARQLAKNSLQNCIECFSNPLIPLYLSLMEAEL